MTHALLWAATAVASWNSVPAQAPGSGACTGFVRAPDGSPLRDAEVLALPQAATDDVVGAEGLAPRPAPLRATTDAGGAFRLELATPAVLWVRHANGLGLVWPYVAAHDALRLVAQPMAEVALPAGATGAHVARGNGSDELALGFWAGTTLRLPGGAYRLLVAGDAARFEVRVTLRAGEHARVSARAASPWRVRLGARADVESVVVDGWRDAALTPDGEGYVSLWPSAGATSARALAVAIRGPHGARVWQNLVVDRDSDAPALPTMAWRALRAQGARAVLTLQRRADGDGRGIAWSPTHEGVAQVPVLDDTTFIALRTDGGMLTLGDAADAEVDTGVVTIAVHDAERPLAGAWVELDGPPPQVRRRVRTNSAGHARFVGVPRTPGFARLLHDELCSDDVILDGNSGGSDLLRLRARPGATLQGRVTVAGDPSAPLNAIEVTLRDPTGTDGVATRRAPVTAAGGFAFRGLDADRRYTLFATLRRGAVTFSAKLHGVDPGAPVLLTLRSEDPLPPGRGR